jgi:hypothetical protein
MERIWVRSTADPKLHTKVPGVVIRIYGHDFETQLDGTLCMRMNPAFVKDEVKAGRVRVMKMPPAGTEEEMTIVEIEKTEGPVFPFTLDVKTYYGAGDLNSLIEKITAMKMEKKDLIMFANERFKNHNLKMSMKTEDMIDNIRTLTDSAYIKKEED